MAINLPYEVKRLIYCHVDLETLKSLRLVSTSWAVVGLELLLLPSFVIKSYSLDVRRLNDIGACPSVSRQAARVIKTIKFYNNDWDAQYLRSIVCSRHSHLSNYEVVDFVPTLEEQQALDELDSIIQRKHCDDEQALDVDSLTHAFRQTPQASAIEVISPNPFKHRLLRKVWDEYNMETYLSFQNHLGPRQLVDILSAAKEAKLDIQHMGHDQLTSYFFTSEVDQASKGLYEYLNRLNSLDLTINDQPQEFISNPNASARLREIISVSPELENISIKFESLSPVPLDFLPNTEPLLTKLHTLTLSRVIMDTVRFFSFLGGLGDTLRRLSISSPEMAEGSGTWKEFLEEMKNKFGLLLEKFQLTNIVRSSDDGGETWMLLPIYNSDWIINVYSSASASRNQNKAKDIESFVLRGGDWPMTSEDDISSLVA